MKKYSDLLEFLSSRQDYYQTNKKPWTVTGFYVALTDNTAVNPVILSGHGTIAGYRFERLTPVRMTRFHILILYAISALCRESQNAVRANGTPLLAPSGRPVGAFLTRSVIQSITAGKASHDILNPRSRLYRDVEEALTELSTAQFRITDRDGEQTTAPLIHCVTLETHGRKLHVCAGGAFFDAMNEDTKNAGKWGLRWGEAAVPDCLSTAQDFSIWTECLARAWSRNPRFNTVRLYENRPVPESAGRALFGCLGLLDVSTKSSPNQSERKQDQRLKQRITDILLSASKLEYKGKKQFSYLIIPEIKGDKTISSFVGFRLTFCREERQERE